MDRRDFLKTAGLGVAGAAAASLIPGGLHAEAPQASTGTMAQNYPGVGLLGFGCMRWPMIKGPDGKDIIDQAKVDEMVDLALANGVNYYDTSPVYLQGQSEEAAAKALNRYPREQWLLATKLSNFADASRANSLKMYRRSLELFQTDYIDYYLLHSISGAAEFRRRFEDTGIMKDLLREKAAGHIRALGFSFHGTREGFDELMALHDKYHWDFVQIQMNYVDWNHAVRDANASYMYDELDKREIPITIMEPLRGGRLADLPAPLADRLKSREPSRSLASWAFRFCGSYPRVQCILSGMSYIDHLRDNLETFLDFKPLTEEELAFLDKVGGDFEKYRMIPCTGCQYCMPCPWGIDIPGVFKFYNDAIGDGTYVSGPEQEGYARMRRRYLAKYDKSIPAARQADHCIGCGACVSHCPQRIRIPREMRRIDSYIESLKQETL